MNPSDLKNGPDFAVFRHGRQSECFSVSRIDGFRFQSGIFISQGHFRLAVCKGRNRRVFRVLIRKRLEEFS